MLEDNWSAQVVIPFLRFHFQVAVNSLQCAFIRRDLEDVMPLVVMMKAPGAFTVRSSYRQPVGAGGLVGFTDRYTKGQISLPSCSSSTLSFKLLETPPSPSPI